MNGWLAVFLTVCGTGSLMLITTGLLSHSPWLPFSVRSVSFTWGPLAVFLAVLAHALWAGRRGDRHRSAAMRFVSRLLLTLGATVLFAALAMQPEDPAPMPTAGFVPVQRERHQSMYPPDLFQTDAYAELPASDGGTLVTFHIHLNVAMDELQRTEMQERMRVRVEPGGHALEGLYWIFRDEGHPHHTVGTLVAWDSRNLIREGDYLDLHIDDLPAIGPVQFGWSLKDGK